MLSCCKATRPTCSLITQVSPVLIVAQRFTTTMNASWAGNGMFSWLWHSRDMSRANAPQSQKYLGQCGIRRGLPCPYCAEAWGKDCNNGTYPIRHRSILPIQCSCQIRFIRSVYLPKRTKISHPIPSGATRSLYHGYDACSQNPDDIILMIVHTAFVRPSSCY